MENKLALIFTHKGSSDYLWYCLEQAKKTNPEARIILLGDEANKPYDSSIEHYLISDYFEGATKFESVYRHQSSNPYWYELICFQRWFIINDFVQKNNIDMLYGCDTDIMIYDDLSKYIPQGTFKLTIANNNGPQCSFFTKESINNFCNYIIKQYTNPECLNRLLTRYRGFLTKNRPGGNCDMTMFEFCKIDYPGSVLDLGFMDPKTPNNLIYCCSKNYDWMKTKVLKHFFTIAQIQFQDKKPYILAKDGNKYFVPVVHFLGQYKQFMGKYSTIEQNKKDYIKKTFSCTKPFSKIKFFIKQSLPFGIVNFILLKKAQKLKY